MPVARHWKVWDYFLNTFDDDDIEPYTYIYIGICSALIIIIIEGLSLLQSIPPTTADKQTQAQKRRGSRSRKLLSVSATYCPGDSLARSPSSA